MDRDTGPPRDRDGRAAGRRGDPLPILQGSAWRDIPWDDEGWRIDRRDFLRLVGASIALAGIGGCFEPPREEILPYTIRPPEVTPGVPRYYATTMTLDGYGIGLLAESREGRPTKIEGNPDHPASLGAAGVYEQASVLGLYDPDRARRIREGTRPRTWLDFARRFAPQPPAGAARGAGLRFLLEPTASPLTAELVARIREAYPEARFHFYAPLASASPLDGARLALGRPLQTQYDFRSADVVLSIDADFLDAGPFGVRHARDFASRRRPRSPTDRMSRLYVVEGGYSITGGMADHRIRVRTDRAGEVLAAVLARVTEAGPVPGLPGAGAAPAPDDLAAASRAVRAPDVDAAVLDTIARDLRAHPGRSIVLAGDGQPPEVHAMAHALNALLGNVGRTVWYNEPPLLDAGEPSHSLAPLVEEMRAGTVRTLLILGGNPIYDAPADLDFAGALRRVPETVYLGLHENETAALASWFVPALHYLEVWGDARAWDGTASLVQPLISPLYDGRSVDDVLAVFLGETNRSVYALLREHWRRTTGLEGEAFDAFWNDALRRGVIPGTGSPRVDAEVQWGALLQDLARSHPLAAMAPPSAPSAPPSATRPPASTAGAAAGARSGAPVLVTFRRDPAVHDGRFANNAWLQEFPDPLTRLTWGNAALLSPATAARLGIRTGDLVEIRYPVRTAQTAQIEQTELADRARPAGPADRTAPPPVVHLPAYLLPGHAEDEVSLHLGYGRAGAEATARGVGTNVYPIRTTASPYFAAGAELRRVAPAGAPGVPPLAVTQDALTQEGRPIALATTLARYRADPDLAAGERGPPPSLHDAFEYDEGDQWAMAIDLSACTGCGACVVACQAENNTPVVGAEGVRRGREMHWLRIDRYFDDEGGEPDVVFQPMLCQHCERAPCEYVCPVNATVHSPDGLNEMVYNRCIGTRFCSNNCPYKVRRFNWFDYNAEMPETVALQKNPDVTVRARGVMEKCTFCVQRIRRAQIAAAAEGRRVRPGEVRTACQQTCPTEAIVFGSLTDPDEELLRRLRDPRRYVVLHELGTRPRVRYLAKLTNPAPEADPNPR